ncbi:DUF1403 family protein [Tropicibacter sp. Alg240-R139]|uniref:DUF1403 family protein n=1 Tax=Tropicibacter sp. Alg240-R139 TaxID=2305991 RepID=UPI0013DFEFB0|nr:DUF1403 family protein [Tropicibacter sp. Alg240-R139]
MIYDRPTLGDSYDTVPKLPSWITSSRVETPEDVAFLSGAALSHLHLVFSREEVPQSLLRDRLSLTAAEACVAFSGRPERVGELRDAMHFLRPGDLPGPAGETYLSWRRALERPISIKALHRAIPGIEADRLAEWVDAGQGTPVTRAATVLETVLKDLPRQVVSALILADAALAQALGWDHVVPSLAAGLKRRDLRKTGTELRLACHRAVTASCIEAVRLAADLARREARLKVVAPKLRARGAEAAVEMFLSRDAVTPTVLADPIRGVNMSNRAARRFCDRLVELGVVRELTGRDTFRLYGV